MLSKFFTKRFGLTKEGSDNLIKGIFYTALLNISFMFPVGLYALLIYLWVEQLTVGEIIDPNLGIFILLILIVLGIIFAFAWKQYHFVFNTTYVESGNRRINLGENLRKLPLSFFENRDLADLTATIMNDCTDLEHVFSHAVPQLMGSIISLCIVSVGMFLFDWRLAIALLWVVPVAFIILFISKRLIYIGGDRIMADLLNCGDAVQECIESIGDLKSYNCEEEYYGKIGSLTSTIEKSRINAELMATSGVIVGKVVLNLGIVSVILLGSYLIINSQISIFTFLIFLIASATVYSPLENGLIFLAEIFMMDNKITRAQEIESLVVEGGLADYSLDSYDVEFENVSFNYDDLKDVLTDISFTAKQGEVTALIGPSGGGKSTVSKLAARFWDINKGKILLGGEDISKVDPEALLKNFSIVFQEVVLFNTSIKENIRIGKKGATDAEIFEAAKIARCDEFIEKMPNGIETVIGENGERLSGGERQRISIARAILKDAPIILMDEATASLDVENESLIQEALSELIREKTVIVIAHRMRTIRSADKIVFLNNGEIEAIGNDKEMYERSAAYRKMLSDSKIEQTVTVN